MSWLSNLGTSALGGLIAGGTSDYFNSKAQQRQFEYNKLLYQNRYQWQVDDMRKAGLNPVLAGLNGSVGSAGSVGMVGANTASTLGGDYNSARQIDTIQKKQLENQTKQTDSSLKLNAAQEKRIAGELTRMEVQNAVDAANSAANVRYLTSQDFYLKAKTENEKIIANAQSGYFGALGTAAMMDACTRLYSARQQSGLWDRQGKFYDEQTENWKYKNVRDKAGTQHYDRPLSSGALDLSSFVGEIGNSLGRFWR